MFNRVLIANRGEIALRILRACRELGIETVAVFSEADRDSPHVRFADRAICIGPGPSRDSYLDASRILSAAEISDVQAIHPGYGFLSENADFAEMVQSCNITFIGPSPAAARLAGDKVQARQLSRRNRIPTLPGSEGAVKDEKAALDLAHQIGYPVVLKAAGGGGGRGIRVVHNDVSLSQAFHQAGAEAGAAFKNGTLYLEKYIENARHIEVQILADGRGNIVHLGERDCTIQRRFQKLIEEAPSPVITSSQRKELGYYAVLFARACRYVGAGTVEFLMDGSGKFFFIEMNARIQVEHPVTEMVTGIDIVKEQIRIAAGEPLTFSQRDVTWNGFAIEARINAEDPSNGFRPSPGRITRFVLPGGPGVRVDTHVSVGYEVPPYYDSLIAKVIVHRKTHEEAVNGLRWALKEMTVDGVKTTLPLLLQILNHPTYTRGQIRTSFVDELVGKA